MDEGQIPHRRSSCRKNFICDEFKFENFWFNYHDTTIFYKSFWPIPAVLYVIYRVSIAIYILAWLIDNAMSQTSFEKYAKFLTNWSFCCLSLYLLASAGVALYLYIKERKSTKSPGQSSNDQTEVYTNPAFDLSCPDLHSQSSVNNYDVNKSDTQQLTWYMIAVWWLYAIMSHIVYMITLVYYLVLHGSIEVNVSFASDIHMHGINSVVMFIDLWLTAIPIRLLHYIYPVSYFIVYIIFSTIYWSADKENNVIYSIMDWNYPTKSALTTCMIILAGAILQLIIFLIAKFKEMLRNSCSK